MTVYLIPTAPGRYELYCEQPTAPDVATPRPGGWSSRLRDRFSSVLREAEEQRKRGHAHATPADSGIIGRLRHRALAWVAERIAEQRLLWNLRSAAEAVTAHPDDMSFADAHQYVRTSLGRDYDRHRIWLVVDTVLLAASAILAIIPGPNIVAYYFAFRVVGHWLSMRGASQGLNRTRWTGRACPPLTELRTLPRLGIPLRTERLQAIARELSLEQLPAFYERVTS